MNEPIEYGDLLEEVKNLNNKNVILDYDNILSSVIDDVVKSLVNDVINNVINKPEDDPIINRILKNNQYIKNNNSIKCIDTNDVYFIINKNNRIYLSGKKTNIIKVKKLLYDVLKQDEIIVASDNKYYINGLEHINKVYSIVNRSLLENINNENLYELITDYKYHNYYYKLYLDIDATISKQEVLEETYLLDTYRDAIITDIIKLCKEKFEYSVDASKIFIASSSGKKDDYFKYSIHIHLPIYFINPEHIYLINTLFKAIIYDKYKYNDKSIVDKNVYIKNEGASELFRILGQSKLDSDRILKPLKVNGYGFSKNTSDYLITTKPKTSKKIFDITKLKELLNLVYKKHNFDNKITDDVKNEIINLNIKNFRCKSYLTFEKCCKMLYDNNNIETKVKIILNTIPNTPTKRNDYDLWIILLICCKSIGLKHYNDDNKFKDEFITFTSNAYLKIHRKKHLDNALKIWDNTDINPNNINIGFSKLFNIASYFDKEFTLKMLFAELFDNFYNVKKLFRLYNFKEFIISDPKEKISFINLYLQGFKTIATSLNIGEGKTEAFIALCIYIIKNVYENLFIIFISNRRLYCSELNEKIKPDFKKENIKPVYNYLDGIQDINLKNYSGIIISPESLTKCMKAINKRTKSSKKLV